MGGPWEKYQNNSKVVSGPWEKYGGKSQPQNEEIPAIIRNFVQGGSANFSDEFAGGIEAAGKVAGIKGLGGPMKDISADPGGPSLSWEDLKNAYTSGRDKERQQLAQDKKDYPAQSLEANLLGSVVSPVNKLTGGMNSIKSGITLGGLYSAGGSNADNPIDIALDTTKGAAIGGAVGAVAPMVQKGVNSVGSRLKSFSNDVAENSTGATGRQSQKFADNAGEELQKRGIVQFGDSPQNIADKANAHIEQAQNDITDSLSKLDTKGVTVSQNAIIKNLQNKISTMGEDASKAPIIKQLKSIIDDIGATGKDQVKVSFAEQIKRGFDKLARNWQDPQAGEAGKIVYRAYRDAVEDAALSADPQLAKQFTDAKKTYGLLNPIADAAEKRAATLNQSPYGGLLDTAAGAGVGGMVGGIPGAIAGAGAVIGRKVIAPRIASSVSATAQKLGGALAKSNAINEVVKDAPSAVQDLFNQPKSDFVPQLQKAASSDTKVPDKWVDNGIKKIESRAKSGELPSLKDFKDSKEIRDLLNKANDAKNPETLDKIIQQIKNTEDYKKRAPASMKHTGNVYPKTLIQKGHEVTVMNDRDYHEAKAEGWL